MLQVEWREEYVIDNGVIDEEHKRLLDMANDVFALIDPEAQKAELIALVKALYCYMESHFEHEETLMQEAEFPQFATHAEKHRRIIAEMNQALRVQKDLNQYAAQLRHLMVDWVVQHIIDEDRKVAPYLDKSYPK